MTMSLSKGSSFPIKKSSLAGILIGCGWNPAARAGEEFDLDAHAFGLVTKPDGSKSALNANGKYPYALTYANKDGLDKAPSVNDKAFQSPDGVMIHMGDNRTGAGEGDDELIKVALDKLPAGVTEVTVHVTIYDAKARQQQFGQVQDAYVRILDAGSNEELCRYALAEKFATEQSVQVGSLIRTSDGWSFTAIGAGSPHDLGGILAQYQIQ